MNRRPRLPGADELFRATAGAAHSASPGGPSAPGATGPGSRGSAALAAPARAARVSRALEAAPDDWDDGAEREAASPAATAALVYPASAPSEPLDDEPAGQFAQRGTNGRPVRIARRGDARPTGRERHDEKITVYCSPEELLQLEHARLALRASHGLAVDRGRIVREAIAVVLADLEAKGDASILVRRLRGR